MKYNDPDLVQLISMDIPEQEQYEDGFLEIIQMSHHENINSRIYAYFLNSDYNSKISSLFLQALLELIEIKSGKQIILDDYTCITEESTNNGKRIDITIRDIENKSSIIIENKIYHHLDNDLVDYWNHIDYPEENKVGILLTLNPHSIPQDARSYFVNVEHLEWINKIKEIGLPSGISIKQYTYLNDFFRTIENLSKNYEMNEQTLFFFQHSSKVLKANATIQEANKFMNQQLEVLAQKLNLSLYGTSNFWRNLWDEKNKKKTFYTIIFKGLMEGNNTIQIIIELEHEDKNREQDLRNLLKDDECYSKMNKTGDSKRHYIHFAKRKYVLTIEEIKDFSDVVEEIIRKDFEPTMNKIMEYLYPSK